MVLQARKKISPKDIVMASSQQRKEARWNWITHPQSPKNLWD